MTHPDPVSVPRGDLAALAAQAKRIADEVEPTSIARHRAMVIYAGLRECVGDEAVADALSAAQATAASRDRLEEHGERAA